MYNGGMDRMTTVRAKVEEHCGLFCVSSDDVSGLYLAGDDEQRILDSVTPAINYLFKANRGLDVEVRPGGRPRGMNSWPRMLAYNVHRP